MIRTVLAWVRCSGSVTQIDSSHVGFILLRRRHQLDQRGGHGFRHNCSLQIAAPGVATSLKGMATRYPSGRVFLDYGEMCRCGRSKKCGVGQGMEMNSF